MISLIYLYGLGILVPSIVAASELRLIKQCSGCSPLSLTDGQINNLIFNNTQFFDITDQEDVLVTNARYYYTFPTKLKQMNLVKASQDKVGLEEIRPFLSKFSRFKNRYYNNHYGVQASEYLYTQVNHAGQKFSCGFSVHFFNHTWLQPSIIAKLVGREKSNEIVIVGAHLDSINHKNPKNGFAPGADDDGSGISSILEVIRSLAKSGFIPNQSVEFHFYSAEEVGLRGSQAIANKYANDHKNVIGMLQLDMTGYNKNNLVQIITDYTDPGLTQFLRLIIEKYSSYTYFNTTCGYACSDHSSFTLAGFPSVYTSEEIINPELHTAEDTLAKINIKSIAEFAKITLGFIIELAY